MDKNLLGDSAEAKPGARVNDGEGPGGGLGKPGLKGRREAGLAKA